MKINCISSLGIQSPKTVSSAANSTQKDCSQVDLRNDFSTIQNSKNNPTFGNKPWVLDTTYYGVSRYGEITGSEGIRLYEQLKSGNYLDIGDDKFDFSNTNRIRENNLAFLDRIKYSPDKRHFIEYYKNLTGFPDLEQVSKNVKNEFVKAIGWSGWSVYPNPNDVILAGYDGVCSVGRGKACFKRIL